MGFKLSVTQDTDQVDEKTGEKLWRAWFDGEVVPEEFRGCRTDLPLAPFFGSTPFAAVGSFMYHFGACAGVEIEIPAEYFDGDGSRTGGRGGGLDA